MAEEDINSNHKRQWVAEVLNYSSQYDSDDWCATQLIGAPRIYPQYGDLAGTWAPDYGEDQFIEVKYAMPVYVKHLNIYETYNCGAISAIKVKDQESGVWINVWEREMAPTEAIITSRIFSPVLNKTVFKSDEIRIELDCSVFGSWSEIDAIELVGIEQLVAKPNTAKTLSFNYQNLLESEEFTDVQFEVQGRIINSHRNIMAMRSTFFKNILSGELPCKPIHIDNISYDQFKILMFYLYTDSIKPETECDSVCELIRICQWYDLDQFESIGYLYIKENLSHENVLATLVSATKKEPHLEKVERACLKYLAKNFNTVLNNPEFKCLDKSIVVRIAQFYGQFFQKG